MCDVAERLEQMGIAKGIEIAGMKEEQRKKLKAKSKAKSKAKYWYTGICAGKVLMRKKPGDLRSCRKM